MDVRKLETLRAFENQAETYDEDRNGAHARGQYGRVLEAVGDMSFKSVLDAGCGTGALLKRLALLRPTAELTGVDLSPKMIDTARDKLNGAARLLCADAEELPFDGREFDLLICSDSFHHYPRPERAAAEFYRVLKDGGTLLISDYWRPFPVRQVMNLFMPFSREGDVRVYSRREISALLYNAGFEGIVWRRSGSAAFIVTAKKRP